VGRKLEDAVLARPAPSLGPAGAACWPAVLLLAGALVLGYGASLVRGGRMTAGELVAFETLLALAAVPVVAAVGLGPELLRLDLSLRRLAEVREVPPEEGSASRPACRTVAAGAGEPAALPPLRGLIRLDDVSFRYHPESPNALAGLNLTIPAGQMVAVLGRAGAGKTTLALLLQRLYQPTEGKIRIDGIDLGGVPVSALRAQVAAVGHEPALLAATARDNIALADPNAPLERVIEAAKLAGAHDFIMAWPQDYDTLLGPGGARPSAGQALALGLARALLTEPRLLILDGVLAGLDPDAEAAVMRALRAARGRTTLLLGRRPLPPAYADWIVVLDAGRVVEAGSHGELLEQKGLYSYWAGRV
jgi:subfamily B ATP-binding cassette protein HlyB/CyaB